MLWLLLKDIQLGGRTRDEKGAQERAGGLTIRDLPSSPPARSLFAPPVRRWRLASLAIMSIGGTVVGFLLGIGMPTWKAALVAIGVASASVVASLIADNIGKEPRE
ncbi:MAG: hypothetical protein OXC31_26700 [Spirochaetaceae bacterium]|nr:hypothetical protein [Spirochaetaceae bacterium]